MQRIKKIFKKTIFYNIFIRIRKFFASTLWAYEQYPISPPDRVKSGVVKEYAQKFNIETFFETGTYLGQMIDGTRENFKEIVSIELDKNLFERAKHRFSEYKNITILQGDSSELLPEYIQNIRQPILFWLDAHYSAGFTAKGKLNTPIMKELGAILIHPFNNEHVILIDDARHFNGEDDYPTLDELRQFALNKNPNLLLNVKDDIIRIHKKIPQKLQIEENT